MTSALPRNRVLVGDAGTVLAQLPASSVDCVVTSPPYFGLRDYEIDGQIGLERSVHDWVTKLLDVTRELARVLKPQGSVWLNVNDSYSYHRRDGAPPKGMLLAPERLLLALTEQGWIVRSKVVWAKPAPLPSAAKDRLTGSWEPIYFLVRRTRGYYFDLDAIRIPHTTPRRRPPRRGPEPRGPGRTRPPRWATPRGGDLLSGLRNNSHHPLGKNPGDVWTHHQSRARDIHHAVYPETLIERPLLATCPERVCVACGRGWRRDGVPAERRTPQPACSCDAPWMPGVVLDPFLGSGTTALVAERLRRHWIGIELNSVFAALSQQRLVNRRNGHRRD